MSINKNYIFNPQHIEEIYNYCKTHTLEESKKQFLPDVSEYEGYVLVICSYSSRYSKFFRQGSLIKDYVWTRLNKAWDSKERLCLGEIAGKHSEVFVSLEEFMETELDDPYDIFQEIKINEIKTGDLESMMLDKINDSWVKDCMVCEDTMDDIYGKYRSCSECGNVLCEKCLPLKENEYDDDYICTKCVEN